MGHNVRRLLLVLAFGAVAAMATSEVETTPFPSPADIPATTPPCLDSISVCRLVDQEPYQLVPCCAAVKVLFGDDPECVCDAVSEAQKFAKRWGVNDTVDGLEMFRRCKMPLNSCDPGKPGQKNASAGSQSIGNAAPSARSYGVFEILLAFLLFFLM